MKRVLAVLVTLGVFGGAYAVTKQIGKKAPTHLSQEDVWHRRSILNEAKGLTAEKDAVDAKFKKLQAEYDLLMKPYDVKEGDAISEDGVITKAPPKAPTPPPSPTTNAAKAESKK